MWLLLHLLSPGTDKSCTASSPKSVRLFWGTCGCISIFSSSLYSGGTIIAPFIINGMKILPYFMCVLDVRLLFGVLMKWTESLRQSKSWTVPLGAPFWHSSCSIWWNGSRVPQYPLVEASGYLWAFLREEVGILPFWSSTFPSHQHCHVVWWGEHWARTFTSCSILTASFTWSGSNWLCHLSLTMSFCLCLPIFRRKCSNSKEFQISGMIYKFND